MSILQVSGIGLQEAGNVVLQDIGFSQRKMQKLAIAGETGSGKSTLLQIIAGLVQPDAGTVNFDGRKVVGPQDQLMPGHAGIAYLSQQFELPRFLRVEQVLQYASKLTPEEAENLFRICRIDKLLKRNTNQVSGGERQRIALARLLLGAPRLLLLDEPYSNLDMVHKNVLKSVLREVGQELKITQILISHDPLDTLSWADEILVMKAGKVIQEGTPRQVYEQPVNAYAASLFGHFNLIPVKKEPAFAALFGLAARKKPLLIRPEKFSITTSMKNRVAGKIERVAYYGSYSEAEIKVAEFSLTIKTENNRLNKNDQVFISLAAEDVWYF